MRAIPLTVTALAATLLLTGCGSDGGSDSAGKDHDDTACRIDGVSVRVGPANAAPAAGDTGDVPVTISNRGAECTLEGFPGVTLSAGGTSVTVPSEQAGTPQRLTLAKDGTASFTLTYVRGAEGDAQSLDAAKLRLTLPGATDSQSFPWSFGPVRGKKDAHDPDASVTAFQQAGD
ncbi:DUF4232 domain-containing protein [Streptomyces sp. NPDC003697]